MLVEKPNKRYAYDLSSRLISGIFFYPVLWTVVSIGSDLHTTNTPLFWGALAAFTVMAIIRWVQLLTLTRANESSLEIWLKLLPFVHLPPALLWGVLFAYALTTSNDMLILLFTFATAGMVPGGTYNFAPDLKLGVLFIAFMIFPAAICSLLITEQWFLFALLMIYAGYILNLAIKQKNDYWAILTNELLLSKPNHIDPLTKLNNRRSFDEKLNDICKLSSRSDKQLSVLLIDCDHFKKVNDEFGHDTGDQSLQHLATIIQQQLQRSTDVCARYGGEQFSVILPGADLQGASMVAERIRSRIAASPLALADHPPLYVTVSIGAVTHSLKTQQDSLSSELFKQADNALNEAKAAGRNCCFYLEYDERVEEYEYRLP